MPYGLCDAANEFVSLSVRAGACIEACPVHTIMASACSKISRQRPIEIHRVYACVEHRVHFERDAQQAE